MFNPPLRLLAAYQQQINQTPELVVQVPGREMWVAAHLTGGHEYTVITPDLDGRTVFDRRSAKRKQTTRNRPLPRWARYLTGPLLVLSDAGLDLPGGTILIVGDEPPGPRYEHALGMAFSALCYEHHHQPYTADDLLEVMEQVQKHYLD